MRPFHFVASLFLGAATLAPAPAIAQSTEAPYFHAMSIREAEAGAVTRMVQPEFPLKAARLGIEKGYIEARLHLDDEGDVASVEVTRSHPIGAFDRAATTALRQWRFKKGAVGKTVEVSIDFFRAAP